MRFITSEELQTGMVVGQRSGILPKDEVGEVFKVSMKERVYQTVYNV